MPVFGRTARVTLLYPVVYFNYRTTGSIPSSLPVKAEFRQDLVWEYDTCLTQTPSCVISGSTLRLNEVYRVTKTETCYLVLEENVPHAQLNANPISRAKLEFLSCSIPVC